MYVFVGLPRIIFKWATIEIFLNKLICAAKHMGKTLKVKNPPWTNKIPGGQNIRLIQERDSVHLTYVKENPGN